jgi:hypothetical protein
MRSPQELDIARAPDIHTYVGDELQVDRRRINSAYLHSPGSEALQLHLEPIKLQVPSVVTVLEFAAPDR